MMRYGTTYSLADFFDRLVPAREPVNRELLKEVCEGIRRLALLQNSNPFITLQATLSAGIWINFKGQQYFLLNPAKKFLRVGAAYRNADAAARMESHLTDVVGDGSIEVVESVYLKQWRFTPSDLPMLWEFFEQLPRPTPSEVEKLVGKHPRFFPSEDRSTALEEFEKGGRICPGVGKKIVAHHVAAGEPIEFDHIIPYSRGGASSYWNLQILCAACNNLKRATAA